MLRFGEMAIQMRLLSADQVEEGLRAQEESRDAGLNRSIGACLHDREYLDLVQVQNIMRALGYEGEKARLLPDIELLELIGRGASGAVYRGRSISLGEDVAVKVRAPRGPSDDPEGNRFRAEAQIGKRLIHPNIVRLFDAGETRDFVYHVFEFVDGIALDRLLKARGQLMEAECVDIAIQLASALECAEREGIVHRDIKPANVLIAKTGRVKLCDLGLAKDLRRRTMVTADGVLLGSPFYLAPEYAEEGKIDARSDIYGLGVTLFHCATGVVPFPGKTVIEILERVVRGEVPDPLALAPHLTKPFTRRMLKMMARDPAQRYQHPSEVVEAFKQLRSGLEDNGAHSGLFRRLGDLIFGKKK